MAFPYSSSITHHTPSFLSLMVSESSQMFLMLCELSWEVVMMCLMRDENERERDMIFMNDDVDEVNNTCLVVVGKHD